MYLLYTEQVNFECGLYYLLTNVANLMYLIIISSKILLVTNAVDVLKENVIRYLLNKLKSAVV